MQAAPSLEPVWAVILVQDSFDAQQARVLLGNDEYFTYPGPRNTERDILAVAHLAVAAKARAESKLREVVDEAVLVYTQDPREGGTPDDDWETPPSPLQPQEHRSKVSGAEVIADDRRGLNGGRNPYFVLVTRKPETPRSTQPHAETIVLTPAAKPPDVQIIHNDLPTPTEQILGLYGMGAIEAHQAPPSPPLRPPGTPPDIPTLVANILFDMRRPLPEALQQLLKSATALPIGANHSLFQALMDRADVRDPADRTVWNALHSCFAEASSSTDKSSFVFLTGTSGVGKSKIAADIGRRDALVVMVPAKESHDAHSASTPYTLLFNHLQRLRDQAANDQQSLPNFQECATICFGYMVLSHLEVVIQVCENAIQQGIDNRETLLEIAIRAQRGAYTRFAAKAFEQISMPTDPYEGKRRLFEHFQVLLDRSRRMLPDTQIVIFHDEAQFLLNVHHCDAFFEGAWAHLKQNIQRNGQDTSQVASERPPKGPHSGLFYALICTIRYLCGGSFAESVGHVVAGTNMKMTFYMLNHESPAQGAAKHVNVTTCLSADDIRDWYASYLSDDAMAALEEFERPALQTLQGRPLFASWFWRTLVHCCSLDLSPAENVRRAVTNALKETTDDARKRVHKLWAEREAQSVLCGLYYSLKAGHGGLVRIAARAFTQLEQAIIGGVLNVEATGPDVLIDLEMEPATANAILDIGNQSLASTYWGQDPVVEALQNRCIGFFGTEKLEGELLEDLFVWHVLKMCQTANRPVFLKDILWGSQDEKYWPNALDDLTVHVKYGLRCPKDGGFLSAFDGANGEPRFDLILHHPPDTAASEDVIFPAMSREHEFRKVGVQCKKKIASGLPDALRSLDMGKWYPDIMTERGPVRTQPNREFVDAFRKHPEWFASPVRVVLHSKRFKPSVLHTAAFYNVAVVPEQPIVLTTMGLLREFFCDGQVDNPRTLQNFVPTPIRHWHELQEHREHPQQYLIGKHVYSDIDKLPKVSDTLHISCICERRESIYAAIRNMWPNVAQHDNPAFVVTFSNVHDAIAFQIALNSDEHKEFWRWLGVESVEAKEAPKKRHRRRLDVESVEVKEAPKKGRK